MHREHSKFSLASGAPGWVPACALATVPAAAFATRARGRRRAGALAIMGASAAVCSFFRDPQRQPGEGVVLAPADGVISAVERERDGRLRIATFMRLQDVHVNRAPVTGTVRELHHRPGGYRPAFHKGSDLNERLEWTIDTALGQLRIVQIAGLVARRIVAYCEPGEHIERGQRIGMIRFGSRVDVILPAGIVPGVGVGQRVCAGRTRLDLS